MGKRILQNWFEVQLSPTKDQGFKCTKDNIEDSVWSLRVFSDAFWVDECTNCIHGPHEYGVPFLPWSNFIIFIDDILVYSRNAEEHAFHLRIILQALKDRQLEFWLNEVVFLELFFWEWYFMDPRKVKAIVNWERPKNVIEIRSFLGLVGYYKRFVKHFSLTFVPLTQLT